MCVCVGLESRVYSTSSKPNSFFPVLERFCGVKIKERKMEATNRKRGDEDVRSGQRRRVRAGVR